MSLSRILLCTVAAFYLSNPWNPAKADSTVQNRESKIQAPQNEVFICWLGNDSIAIERQIRAIAITASAEARRSRLGMELVIDVITARLCDGRFGGTPYEVVTQRRQFSVWNDDSPVRARLQAYVEGVPLENRDLERQADTVMEIARRVPPPAWSYKGNIVYRHSDGHEFISSVDGENRLRNLERQPSQLASAGP
jgi:hypothetical protein